MRTGWSRTALIAAITALVLAAAGCTGGSFRAASAPSPTAAAGTTTSPGRPAPVPAQWQLTHPGPEHAIEGYADHVSVHPGDRVALFVARRRRRSP